MENILFQVFPPWNLHGSTAGRIVKSTCRTIGQVLKREFVKLPVTAGDWMEIVKGHQFHRQLPQCIPNVNIYIHKNQFGDKDFARQLTLLNNKARVLLRLNNQKGSSI